VTKPRIINTRCFSSAEYEIAAEKLEARIIDPKDPDDAHWLRRRAENIRAFAQKRSKSRLKKAEERRKHAVRIVCARQFH
jgi:hypothetical protein